MKTLDDFAVGINYNKEPYTSNNKFSVVVPDLKSQHKFLTVDNYTHKYITQGRYDKMKEQDMPQKEEHTIPAKEDAVEPIQEAIKPDIVKTPKKRGKSIEKTLPIKVSPMKTSQYKIKTFAKLPKKISVYNSRELYVAKSDKLSSSFIKANPYKGTRYYDMTSVFGLNKDNTLGDVLRKSQEVEASTQTILKMQQSKQFLASQCLPPIPKERARLTIVNTLVCKNPYKKISNETHIKMTNGGYSRTTYGGYFMQ